VGKQYAKKEEKSLNKKGGRMKEKLKLNLSYPGNAKKANIYSYFGRKKFYPGTGQCNVHY
jgi:hypothetical protein